jgi:hypothetical protein
VEAADESVDVLDSGRDHLDRFVHRNSVMSPAPSEHLDG